MLLLWKVGKHIVLCRWILARLKLAITMHIDKSTCKKTIELQPCQVLSVKLIAVSALWDLRVKTTTRIPHNARGWSERIDTNLAWIERKIECKDSWTVALPKIRIFNCNGKNGLCYAVLTQHRYMICFKVLTGGAAFLTFLPRFVAFLPPSSPPPPFALYDSRSFAYCSLASTAFFSHTYNKHHIISIDRLRN